MFGPFVVLHGEDGTDEANDGVAVGRMPTTSVRRLISRLSRPPKVVGSDLSRDLLEESGEGEDVPPRAFQVVGDGGSFSSTAS